MYTYVKYLSHVQDEEDPGPVMFLWYHLHTRFRHRRGATLCAAQWDGDLHGGSWAQLLRCWRGGRFERLYIRVPLCRISWICMCIYIYLYNTCLSWSLEPPHFFCLDRNKVICNLLMFYGPHRSLVLCFFTDGMTSMFDFRSRAEKHKTTCHCKMLALDLINW